MLLSYKGFGTSFIVGGKKEPLKKVLLCALFLLLCAASALAEIEISEVMASNGVYINGEAYDWVELHNTGKKTVDLSGCYLDRKSTQLGEKDRRFERLLSF